MQRSSSHLLLCLMLVTLTLSCCQMMEKKHRMGGKMSRKQMMMALQDNVTELWQKVHYLSQPVHVHVHGMDGQLHELVPEYTVKGEGHGHHMIDHEAAMEEDEEESNGGGEEEEEEEEEEKDKSGEEEEEEDSSSEESSEEDEHDGQSGTHVHIHLNLGAGAAHGGRHGGRGGEEKEKYSYPKDEFVYARCDMLPNNAISTQHRVRGSVIMRQKPGHHIEVKVDLYGFDVRQGGRRPEEVNHLHGIHVHQYGDLSDGCNSFGGHFNPEGVVHGGREHKTRHAGDWGNIECDHRGVAKITFEDKHSTLIGPGSIVGRGIVLHERADDEGQGQSEASKASGDAGGQDRLLCGQLVWWRSLVVCLHLVMER